jgi:hypothetical protein
VTNELTAVLVPALGSLLVALLAWLTTWVTSLIRAKVKNTYLEGVLVRTNDAVLTAVKMVAQTYVDEVRKAAADGALTDAEKAAAKQKAVAAAKAYLGPQGLDSLVKILGLDGGSLDAYLAGKIEAAVADGP